MRKKGTLSFPAPANLKNMDLHPHLLPLFLEKREAAQGQGLTGAETPRGESLWGFIFIFLVGFSPCWGCGGVVGGFTDPPPRTALSLCPRGRGVFPTLPYFR
jgi:hypothetical protein